MRHLHQRTGIEFFEARNHFEAQGGKDAWWKRAVN